MRITRLTKMLILASLCQVGSGPLCVVAAAAVSVPEDYATTQFSGAKGTLSVGAHQMPGGMARVTSGDDNRIAAVEAELQDGILDPATGQPVVSDVPTGMAPLPGPVNFSQNPPDAGFFNSSNPITPGYPDSAMPGGVSGNEYALQLTGFMELKQGTYQMFVNSDDGFKLSIGPNALDVLGVTLGVFDGGRGMTLDADPAGFTFTITKDGVYPFRLVYGQGTGDANLEWYSEQVAGTTTNRYLVNSSEAQAIQTYPEGRGRAYISKFLPYPGSKGVARRPTLSFAVVDDLTTVDPGTIRVILDGAELTNAAKSKTGTTTTVTWTAPAEYDFNSQHTGQFIYAESSGTSRTNAIDFTIAGQSVADFPANSFWIEVEDFDFGKGQSLPEASVMPYEGGKYADLGSPGAAYNIDYHRDDRGPQNNPPDDLTGAGYVYRTDIPEYTDATETVTDYFVPMYSDTGGLAGQRPGDPVVTVSVNYRTGWSQGGWYNYTRTVPKGVYNVYLAGGHWNDTDPATVGQINCSLAKVVAGVGTTNQTLQPLGTFLGPGAGFSGTDVFTPLKAPDGSLAAFKAEGKTTLRLADSAGDIDWFLLVPVVLPARFTGVQPDLRFTVSPDTVITWTFQDFSTTVDTASAKLKVNVADVPAAQFTVVKNGDITTMTYDPPGLFDNGSYTYTLTVLDSAGADLSVNGQFTIGTPPLQALFVVGSVSVPNLNPADAGVKARLEAAGLQVKVIGDSVSQTTDANNMALVMTSSTVSSGNVANKFQTVPVPVVNWEQALEDNYLMTTDDATTHNSTTSTAETQINILKADHPLAAGFGTGPRTVSSGTQLSWGAPAASATIIASAMDDPGHAVIYGYEKGVTLVDGATKAPARRVHFMMTDDTFGTLTPDGLKLFDAAVSWAAGLSAPGEQPRFNPVLLQANQITISWTGGGTLQSSTDFKAWSDVTGAGTDSYTTIPSDAHRFFRIRK